MSHCAHSRTPTPSSGKLHVAFHETPRKDGNTLSHQNECREKWENGVGIQIKLNCSIYQERGKICCHIATVHPVVSGSPGSVLSTPAVSPISGNTSFSSSSQVNSSTCTGNVQRLGSASTPGSTAIKVAEWPEGSVSMSIKVKLKKKEIPRQCYLDNESTI